MKTHHTSIGLERLCTLFGKSRQAYHDHYWLRSDDQLQKALIVELVRMTQGGSPYDNALAERVNGILKTELLPDSTFQSYSAAVPLVH